MYKKITLGVALAVATLCGSAWAQTFPTKPVTIVVPFSPGGATDIMSRLLAERLNKRLGQPVLVENRPGAGTMIASEYVAKSPADGYTLLMGTVGTHGINKALYNKMPFDPQKDFAPVMNVGNVPLKQFDGPPLEVLKKVGLA